MNYKNCEFCGKEIIPFRCTLQTSAIRFCNSYCWNGATETEKEMNMYVPIDKTAIQLQFKLTNMHIRAIIMIKEGSGVPTAKRIEMLRRKGILMPRHMKLTSVGERIYERWMS
jgi:hypothetical protein